MPIVMSMDFPHMTLAPGSVTNPASILPWRGCRDSFASGTIYPSVRYRESGLDPNSVREYTEQRSVFKIEHSEESP